MATKKSLRNMDLKHRKTKKKQKKYYLILIGAAVIVFLFVFFLTLFDHIFQPVNQKGELAKVNVFFADANERFLLAETRHVPKETTVTGQVKEIVKALLDGSKTGKVNTFPPNVSLLNVRIENDTAMISFDENLVKLHPGGTASEITTVYSLTNSVIANIPDIKKVKILLRNKEIESIAGHVDTRHPFVFNKELIAPTVDQRR